MMQRILGLSIVLVMLAIPVASISRAQDGETVIYTSESGLTFSYPEGWIVEEDEESQEDEANLASVFIVSDDTLLNNEEDSEDSGIFRLINTELATGQIGMQIVVADVSLDDSGMMGGVSQMPPAVQTGYFMGFVAFALSFSSGFSDDETESPELAILSYSDVTIQGVAGGAIHFQYGNDGLMALAYLNETEVVYLFVTTPPSEMETHMETIIQILESIEYTPPAE